MMQYASVGVRNAIRKGSNTLIHHGGHNGPGTSTCSNPTYRPIHTGNPTKNGLHAPRTQTMLPFPPRSPPHKLFSASKNLLQRFFTHLTAPGLRYQHISNAQTYASRSLHGTSLRPQTTIQSGLSLPVRNSLRNYALQLQANTFLPRSPVAASPRFGGVAQVGLGIARNFSTTRPIFEYIAQNVPVAVRALYEADLNVNTNKRSQPMGHKSASQKSSRKTGNSRSMVRKTRIVKCPNVDGELQVQTTSATAEDIEHYFTSAPTFVTTYLTIPLAPTASRAPLPPDPVFLPSSSRGPSLLPPLSFVASLHNSHSTHALRVDALFARLDQAHVWSRGGVRCYAYSQGIAHRKQSFEPDRPNEGVCTVLQIEFKGWTKSEVRSVIGESGTGWCMMEETPTQGEFQFQDHSTCDSLASSMMDNDMQDEAIQLWGMSSSVESLMYDPAESFILPNLDLSMAASQSSHLAASEHGMPNIFLSEVETGPWMDEYSASELSSPFSSNSDLSELTIDPPSLNVWDGDIRTSQWHSEGGSTFPSHNSFPPGFVYDL